MAIQPRLGFQSFAFENWIFDVKVRVVLE